MSPYDPQPSQQEAVNEPPLRQNLLLEIACIPPPPSAHSSPSEAPEGVEAEGGNVHPFRDLNLTSFARKVDALFLQRWLDGESATKNELVRPVWKTPAAAQMHNEP